jgi:hypothetical protein
MSRSTHCLDYANTARQLQVSIIVFASLAVASDLAWRKATYNEWGTRYVTGKSFIYSIAVVTTDTEISLLCDRYNGRSILCSSLELQLNTMHR